MNHLRCDDGRRTGLYEPFPGRWCRRPGTCRRDIDGNIDIKTIGQGMKRSGQNLMLEPEASQDQGRPVFGGQFGHELGIEPWGRVGAGEDVFVRQEAGHVAGETVPPGTRPWRDDENRNFDNIGRRDHSGKIVLQTGSDVGVKAVEAVTLRCDHNQRGDHRINERGGADARGASARAFARHLAAE